MDTQLPISKQINEVILNSGRKYAELFENDNLGFTQALLILSGSRQLMKWVYSLLVARKLVTPIEALPQEDKESMWEFVKEVCAGEHQTREKMHQMVIVFYVIEYFLNENK